MTTDFAENRLPALTSRQRTAAVVLIVCLLAFYAAGYFTNRNLPGKSSQAPLGWWGWFDQGKYYSSVKALDQQDFEASEYHYPIGYPLIGSLFYQAMPKHPFLIPNIICFMLICLSFVQICRLFVSFEEAFALCFLGVLWPTTVFENLIYPWTNTPVNAAMMVLIYLILLRPRGLLTPAIAGVCVSVVFLCRPGDIVYSMPLIAVVWVGCDDWRKLWNRTLGFVLTSVPILAVGVYLSFAIHGRLVSESYTKANVAFIGMGFSSLPVKLYTFLVDAFQLFGEKRTLVTVYPILLVALPGFVAFVKELKWNGVLIALTQVGAIVYFLAFNDYWMSNALKYFGIRYWLWLIPFSTLYAYLTFRSAWRILGPSWCAGLIGVPLLLWTTVNMELEPVQPQSLAITGTACNAFTSSTSDLLDDDESTGWRCKPTDGSCSFSTEFAKPIEFDFLKLRGIFPPLDLLYGEVWLDGHRSRAFKDYRDGEAPDGQTLVVFYHRQVAKNIRMVIRPSDPSRNPQISEMQFFKRAWGLGLYSPSARYHPRSEAPLDGDFLSAASPLGFEEATGFSGIESGTHTRWAEGGQSRIAFSLQRARPIQLVFTATSAILAQEIQVLINGLPAASFQCGVSNQGAGARIRFPGKAGRNVIDFRYTDWNHGRSTFASSDPRLLSVDFHSLKVKELASPSSPVNGRLEVTPLGANQVNGDILFQSQPGVTIAGLWSAEAAEGSNPRHRWALSSGTKVMFSMPGPRCVGLEITFVSPDPRIVTTVTGNGKVLDEIKSPQTPLTPITRRFLFDGRSGYNSLELHYSHWNHKDGKAFAPGDPREMTVDLLALRFVNP